MLPVCDLYKRYDRSSEGASRWSVRAWLCVWFGTARCDSGRDTCQILDEDLLFWELISL